MANNFGNLGFRIESPQQFQELAAMVARRGASLPTSVGGAYSHFSTPEGVELWIQFSPDQELIGCNPHFAGRGHSPSDGGFKVELDRIISIDGMPLDGRLVGTIASEDASGCPIVFDVPDFRLHAALLTLPTLVNLQIAAFPWEFSASPTEDAFRADQASALGGPGMASESFIPSGTMKLGGGAIEPPVAQAVLSGRILTAERRTNSLTGLPFYALTVRTLGGVIDMAVDPSLVTSEPVVGGVVFGSFWLSGRLIGPPTPPPIPNASRTEQAAVERNVGGTPPPIPNTSRPKQSLFERLMIAVAILFVAFLCFRVVQFALHVKDHPLPRQAGAEELSQAAKLIVGSSRGVSHGNTAEARALAEEVSRGMKIVRLTMFEGGNPDSIDMQLLTKGDFLVFCQMNEDSCAFLIHVPELRRYTSSAKESIAELAYTTAAKALDSAQKPSIRKLAVATRGNMLYDRVLLGDYSFQSKDPLSNAQKVADEGVLAPPLYPFFAPKQQQLPATPTSTPRQQP